MTYDQYVWKETQSGQWQRATDESEHFYFALAKLFEGSDRMFFAMTGHVVLQAASIAGLSSHESELRLDQALREAWLALRHDHPCIASRVVLGASAGKSYKVYQPPKTSTELQAWLQDTLVSVPTDSTGEEWANEDPPAPKMPTLFVLKPKDSTLRRDLLFRSPHEIIDGIGTLQLLNNLLRHVSKAYQNGQHPDSSPLQSELKNLSPPYRLAANLPPELTVAQQLRMQEMIAQKSSAAKGTDAVPILSIPYKQGALLPGRHQRVCLWISKEQTLALASACKATGATVTHAFHAAIAMVVRDIQNPSSFRAPVGQYVNYILKNERNTCVEPFNSTLHPATVYHSVSGQALVIDLELRHIPKQNEGREQTSLAAEFATILSQIRNFYHQVRDDPDHSTFAPYFSAAGTPELPLDGSIPEVPPPKTNPTASISSMGKLDHIVQPTHGNIEVYNPWVTGEELGNGFGLFLGTFRGQLCLSAAYNDAWHEKDEVLGFLEKCKDVVFRSLEIGGN